jgi:hypothetical protein
MNKKEIELHYLPGSICGIDVLDFHHSTKSTVASSSHNDTSGGSYASGWFSTWHEMAGPLSL